MWRQQFLGFLMAMLAWSCTTRASPADITYSRIVTDKDDMTQFNYNNKNTPDVSPNYGSLSRRVYGKPDSRTGVLVAAWNPNTHKVNPEELGSYASGDILIPNGASNSGTGRNGLVAPAARWPRGVIPFIISNEFSPEDMDKIYLAFEVYHRHTCIHFVPWNGYERDYISIENNATGCWASVGRMGGRQIVNLQSPACLVKLGTPLHELMHAIGFLHEQNRFERDSHVDILWENIAQGKQDNFKKAPREMAMSEINYDFNSVMHYTVAAFSRNGSPTIRLKDPLPRDVSVGQREGLSKRDVLKIRLMYKCNGKYANV